MTCVVVRVGENDHCIIAVCDGIGEAKVKAVEAASKEADWFYEYEIRTQSRLKAFFNTTRWVLKSDYENEPREWMKVS